MAARLVFPLSRSTRFLCSELPYECSAEAAEQVDAIWAQASIERPLFDGSVFTFVSGDIMELRGRFVPYRFAFAAATHQGLGAALGIRPLGVSGVTLADGKVLLGRRAMKTASYPGAWELPPSGSVDRDSLRDDGTVDLVAQLELELLEETGIARARISRCEPLGVFIDEATGVLDAAFELVLADGTALLPFGAPTDEYDELRWMSLHQANPLLTGGAFAVPLSAELLSYRLARVISG